MKDSFMNYVIEKQVPIVCGFKTNTGSTAKLLATIKSMEVSDSIVVKRNLKTSIYLMFTSCGYKCKTANINDLSDDGLPMFRVWRII